MNQLKAGAILSYLIIGINMIVGLIYTPYMLRMLGQTEYGLYSLAASVIGYLTILDLGFGNAIIRYTAKYRSEGKVKEQWELFGMFLKLYISIGFISLIIGTAIYANVDSLFSETMAQKELNTMRIMILLMSLNLAFTFPLSIFGSIISAYENFVFQKTVNLVRVIMSPLAIIVLLFFGYKAIALVIITTLFNFITLSINCWYCFKKLHIKILFDRFNTALLRKITNYSIWIFLAMIMNKVYWSLGQFILGVYQGTDSVAIYAVAIQIVLMFFAFNSAIHSVLLPKITAMVSRRATDDQISNFFIKTGRLQFSVIALLVSGYILIGKEFVIFWAGGNYEQSYIITLILIIPMMFVLIQSVGLSIMQARNTVKFNSLLSICIAAMCVIIAIPMSRYYGPIGCAIATAISLIIGNIIILNIYYFKKQKLNIKKFWHNIIQMSIAPLILMLLFSFVKQNIQLNNLFTVGIFALVYSVIYFASMWLIGLNRDEKNMIITPIKKLVRTLKV